MSLTLSEHLAIGSLVVDDTQGLFQALVVVVDRLKVFVHIEQVACDKRLKLKRNQRLGPMILLLVKFDLLVGRKFLKLLKHFIRHFKLRPVCFECRIFPAQFLAIPGAEIGRASCRERV